MKHEKQTHLVEAFLSCLLAHAASHIPLSHIVGSLGSKLTFYQGAAPAIFGFNWVLGLAFFCFRAQAFFPLFTLPTFWSSLLYGFLWRWPAKVRTGLSSLFVLAGVFLFLHFNGFNCGALYTCSWALIPFASFYDCLFTRSLHTVMAAHLVGTLMYMIQGMALSPAQYVSLIPQTIVERLILMATLIGCISLAQFIAKSLRRMWLLLRKLRYAFGH